MGSVIWGDAMNRDGYVTKLKKNGDKKVFGKGKIAAISLQHLKKKIDGNSLIKMNLNLSIW